MARGDEGNPACVGRHEFGKAVGPFDDHQTSRLVQFVVRRVPDLGGRLRPVEIKVKDGAPGGGIFVEEGEGRAGGRLGSAPACDESPYEVCFAGPEIAGEGNDCPGDEASAEVATGRGRFVGVV